MIDQRGVLSLSDGDVAFLSSAALAGGRYDVLVEVAWPAASPTDRQTLVEAMADSPPRLSTDGRVLRVSVDAAPTGVLEPSVSETCFRRPSAGARFEPTPCPAVRAKAPDVEPR